MIATSKVRDAFHRDPDKFQPNPLGPGYLTREERWREAIAYCRKMDAKRQFHWEQERDGVFACRMGGRIVGRVVCENDRWEWATYWGGWTRECGRSITMDDGRRAVEDRMILFAKSERV